MDTNLNQRDKKQIQTFKNFTDPKKTLKALFSFFCGCFKADLQMFFAYILSFVTHNVKLILDLLTKHAMRFCAMCFRDRY